MKMKIETLNNDINLSRYKNIVNYKLFFIVD